MRAESIFDSTVSVKNISLENIKVFPNPVLKSITISTGELRGCKIKLIDVYGNCLKEIPAFDKLTYINLENFSSGIYFLAIESDAGRRVIKLIKQ
jgi:hypothetical protein